MQKPYALLFFLMLAAAAGFAQQPGQYSLYMLNPHAWNPAYAGLDHSLSFTGVYRQQWAGLPGNPVTQNVNAHLPVYFLSGGFGLNLENESLGAQRITTSSASFNYQRDLGKGILSLGLSAGLAQRSIDGSKLRTPDGLYTEPGVIDHGEGNLPVGTESAITPTFHAGVYYQSQRLEAGFAVQNLTSPEAELGDLRITMIRNYFFTFAMHLEAGRNWSVHPSVLARADAAQLQLDFSGIVRYNDNIFAGASLRGYNSNSLDAISILAGFKLSEKITLAYAYDVTLSALNSVSNGSHEIMLNYNLQQPIGKGRPPRIIYNPRSL